MAGKTKTPKSGSKVKSMSDFDAKWGDRRVDVKEAAKNLGFYATGSLKLDQKLGGGVPKGRMSEFYGPPGGGKTTLALSTLGIAIGPSTTPTGLKGAYFDLERGLDLQSEGAIDAEGFINADMLKGVSEEEVQQHVRKRQSWLRRNGVDPEHPNFHIYDPDNGEEMFEMLGAIVSNQLYDIVVVDSIPAIMPTKVMEGVPGDATYGARAKLLAEELPRLARLYSGNHSTAVIFINQVRENIGAQVKSQKASGGFALDHFVRTKIKIQRIGRDELNGDVITESLCKLEKNITGAYGTQSIYISAQRGVDTITELVPFGIDFGYIHVHGSWYYFFEEPVSAETFKTAQASKSIQEIAGYVTGKNGKGAVLDYMAENGWAAKLLPVVKKTFG